MMPLEEAPPRGLAILKAFAGQKPQDPKILDELFGNRDTALWRGAIGRRGALLDVSRPPSRSPVRIPGLEGVFVRGKPVAQEIPKTVKAVFHDARRSLLP